MLRRLTSTLAIVFALVVSLLSPCDIIAEPLRMGFYDVGSFYDTERSSFYDDGAYTPKGMLQWTPARYERKVRNIAAALDSLGMPIVALHGVESLAVVHDIIRTSNQDYSCVHRTLDFYNKGLDFALLYYADLFEVRRVQSNGYWLCIEVERPSGELIAIHLTRRGYKLLTTERTQGYDQDPLSINELYAPVDITIAWGGFTVSDLKRLDMDNVLHGVRKGDTYNQKYRWHFHSRIGVRSTTDRSVTAAVYNPPWLLAPSRLEPEPTYTRGNRYKGGYSKYLPTYITIE